MKQSPPNQKKKSSRFIIFNDLSHSKFFIFGHPYTYVDDVHRTAQNCTKIVIAIHQLQRSLRIFQYLYTYA